MDAAQGEVCPELAEPAQACVAPVGRTFRMEPGIEQCDARRQLLGRRARSDEGRLIAAVLNPRASVIPAPAYWCYNRRSVPSCAQTAFAVR